MIINYIFILLTYSCIGSFLFLCMDRIPRGEDIVVKASHCNFCGKEIKAYDNIPIISFIILGGKCRYCHQKLSIKYPIWEAVCGVLGVALFIFIQNRFILIAFTLGVMGIFILWLYKFKA